MTLYSNISNGVFGEWRGVPKYILSGKCQVLNPFDLYMHNVYLIVILVYNSLLFFMTTLFFATDSYYKIEIISPVLTK